MLRASLDSLATLNAANINKREKIKPKPEKKKKNKKDSTISKEELQEE